MSFPGMMEHTFCDLCTILRRHQKQKLSYASGSSVFHVGATVTGSTSGATAIIDKAPVGTVASGYLVLRNVIGTFQASETIKDNGSPQGSATTNGVALNYLNGSNEPEYYWSNDQTNVSCRFYSMKTPVRVLESGEYPDQQPWVQLPNTTTINDFEYRIVSTVIGFESTYQIIGPIKPCRNPFCTDEIDHYECQLKEIPGA